jgi:hypothetical protein
MPQRDIGADSGRSVNAPEKLGSESRRRLLRRGVGAAPVIATFTAMPVSASTCLMPSGFISVATFNSRHPNGLTNCSGGKSPSSWAATHQNAWPEGVQKGSLPNGGNGTKFNAIFDPDLLDNPSLYVLLNGYSGTADSKNVAAAIAALYLNAKSNVSIAQVFALEDILALWTNIATNLGYKPPTGPTWSFAETLSFLERTWS